METLENTKIKQLKNFDEIASSFDAFLELRPSLKDSKTFADQVILQQNEGYSLHAIFDESSVVACIGFRIMTTLAWGKILYIDDLIVREIARGQGYGKQLLNFAIHHAKEKACNQVHLDTGYARHAAHKLYLSTGFELNCHHLALNV